MRKSDSRDKVSPVPFTSAPSGTRTRSDALQAGQKRVLELLVQDAPLPEVLTSRMQMIEGQSNSGLLGSILLLDGDGVHLRHGAGPSLPRAYNEAIDGITVGRQWDPAAPRPS